MKKKTLTNFFGLKRFLEERLGKQIDLGIKRHVLESDPNYSTSCNYQINSSLAPLIIGWRS